MRCQDCGTEGAHYRMVRIAGACCEACWHERDRQLDRELIRDGHVYRTDANHHASRKLFAPEPETEPLTVDGWYGGQA